MANAKKLTVNGEIPSGYAASGGFNIMGELLKNVDDGASFTATVTDGAIEVKQNDEFKTFSCRIPVALEINGTKVTRSLSANGALAQAGVTVGQKLVARKASFTDEQSNKQVPYLAIA